MRKENSAAEKRIAELEKQTRKLNDENRRLIADLDDEKAKVMALAEMREEDVLDDEPTPPKKSRRSPVKAKRQSIPTPVKEELVTPSKTPAKKKTKSTPKSKSTPNLSENLPSEEMSSSVSKRGRASKKVVYEEIDVPPVDDEDVDDEVQINATPSRSKKGKGKAKTEEESHSFTEPEDEPSDLPPSSNKKNKAVTPKSKKSPKNSTPKVVDDI